MRRARLSSQCSKLGGPGGGSRRGISEVQTGVKTGRKRMFIPQEMLIYFRSLKSKNHPVSHDILARRTRVVAPFP